MLGWSPARLSILFNISLMIYIIYIIRRFTQMFYTLVLPSQFWFIAYANKKYLLLRSKKIRIILHLHDYKGNSAFVFSNLNTWTYEDENMKLRRGTYGDENAKTRNYDGEKMQKYDAEGISSFRVFVFVVLCFLLRSSVFSRVGINKNAMALTEHCSFLCLRTYSIILQLYSTVSKPERRN